MPKGIKTDPLNKASGSYGIFPSRGVSAGDDFVFESSAGTDLMRLEYDVHSVVILGDASAGSDFIYNDGTNDIVLFESDQGRFYFQGDATAASDFIFNDGTNDIVTFASDEGSFIFRGDGTTGSDFVIRNGAADILQVETDDGAFLFTGTTDADSEFVIDLGGSTGNDFRLLDATATMLLVESDQRLVTWTLDATAGSDWILNDGTNDIVSFATDERAFDFRGDASADSDWSFQDGTNEIVLFESDTTRFTFRGDGASDSDFVVTNAGTDILRIETDAATTLTPTTAFAVVLGTDGGDDFSVSDGTDNLIHIQGDDGSVTFNFATASGNDFTINDGTRDLMLLQADLSSLAFTLDGTAGADFSVADGSSDMLLIQTDDDTVDIVGHDASAKGLMLGGVLVTATAAEINAVADVSARIVTLVATGAITAAAHADHILLMGEVGGDAEAVFTLPAATGTGDVYRFIVSVVNTSNYKIQVVTNDTMDGNILTNSTGDTPDLAQFWPTASDSDTITLDGTTTGGVSIGDWIELIDIATDQWAVDGVTTSSGTEATPFSAAIS